MDLVTRPWVRAVAQPRLDLDALNDFADEHGMADLLDDPGTPLAKLYRNAATDALAHTDLLGELAGRFCYRSFDKGRDTADYLGNVIAEAHGNVLGHAAVSFIITGVSRALSLELIRHHVGTNPSQESQRYVTADGGEIEILGFKATRAVVPPLLLSLAEENPDLLEVFRDEAEADVATYNGWIQRYRWALSADDALSGKLATMRKKRVNEAARAKLPNCIETRLIYTANLRAGRNIVEQRGDVHADLEIRRFAAALAAEFQRVAPISFADVEIYTADDGFPAVRSLYRKV